MIALCAARFYDIHGSPVPRKARRSPDRSSGSLSEAAEAMALPGVHRVPVVDAAGVMVGLVTSTDIVRWVAGLP